MNLKNIILIIALHFICGSTFAQEVPAPKPTSNPEPPQIYEVVDEPADFPGGVSAFNLFVKENLKYPENARKDKIEGTCYLQFIVSENGYISNVRLKKGILNYPECDAEAIRLVKSMPKWVPGKVNGKNVHSVFSLPIKFKL
jgi:periplasmic protein TonB